MVARELIVLGSNLEPNPSAACEAQADERLIADGWVRRYSASADRVQESVALYQSLGFEVLTRDLTLADYDPVCRDCASRASRCHVMIYTRRKPDGACT